MFTVGLTGGIGSGKGAVAACFERLGITVVNADLASRAVVMPGSEALKAIADHFGPAIINSDGTLNRAKLRHQIFADASEKRWLEQLLHPLIAEWIARQLAAAPGPYAILESPLLLETTQHNNVDRILVVDAPEAVQIERASMRDGVAPEQIRAIMASQLPRQERLARADDVIDNAGSLDDLFPQVEQLHQHYIQLSVHKRA